MRMTKLELLHYTVDTWQPRTARELTEEDAREITETLVGFFGVLQQWAANDRLLVRDVRETSANE